MLFLGVGQVFHRVEATPTTRSSDAAFLTAIDGHSIPSRFVRCSSPGDDLDRKRYVWGPLWLLGKLYFNVFDLR